MNVSLFGSTFFLIPNSPQDSIHMRVTSLVAVAASCTGKIIRNPLNVFERGEDLLQKCILQFVQSLEIALKRKNNCIKQLRRRAKSKYLLRKTLGNFSLLHRCPTYLKSASGTAYVKSD